MRLGLRVRLDTMHYLRLWSERYAVDYSTRMMILQNQETTRIICPELLLSEISSSGSWARVPCRGGNGGSSISVCVVCVGGTRRCQIGSLASQLEDDFELGL